MPHPLSKEKGAITSQILEGQKNKQPAFQEKASPSISKRLHWSFNPLGNTAKDLCWQKLKCQLHKIQYQRSDPGTMK